MSIDYKALSQENVIYYGTHVGNWAPHILANLYPDQTHFVFELLQNAEDALRKRDGEGSRSVQFELRRGGLRVSHFGKPFNELDVRGICGINQSTKKHELTAIGRFGIGFKSVFAFTDRPEIRSAGEHFAIESYVRPVEIEPDPDDDNRTIFWFPFRVGDDTAFDKIAQGLRKLDARTLLFLSHIEKVDWQIEGGAKGTHCRESVTLQLGLRRVTLTGSMEANAKLVDESWLVFSRPVESQGVEVGSVEVAYALDSSAPELEIRVRNVPDSRLAAFFPTSVQTNMGVLLQGPYRTTPARDNVPAQDEWNQYLVKETASLLVESLGTLKSLNALSVEVLRNLPINKEAFGAGSMFQTIYTEVAEALRTQELLPTNGTKWLSSPRAALARGQGLRELVDSVQLTALFSSDTSLDWLADDITLDRTRGLHSYLMSEHRIREIDPRSLLSNVSKEFLEDQSDQWIMNLYRFLVGQPSLMKTLAIASKPWVRLEGGTHVVAFSGNQPNAFLPSRAVSGFPTVRSTVCQDEEALEFLKKSLLLTEPDPVDDVIANILPLYGREDAQDHDRELFREHLEAIEAAYATESRNQREKLIVALKQKRWLPSVDNEENTAWLMPSECYLPTERLKQLFEGVSGINFVDDSVPGLQGEAIRKILIACGSQRYLATVAPIESMTHSERNELRRKSNWPGFSGSETEDDRTLLGLDAILARIAELPSEEAATRCWLLWEALADVVQDKREGIVKATYSWLYYSMRSVEYPAAFIRALKTAKWIPTTDGCLTSPDEAVFEQIEPSWSQNAVLQSALNFRPSEVDQLAQAFGLDPKMFSLLKKRGITSEALLKQSLGISDEAAQALGDESADDTEKEETNAVGDSAGHRTENAVDSGEGRSMGGSSGLNTSSPRSNDGKSGTTSKHKNSPVGRREFVSYLATNPVDEEAEDVSDSTTYEERMRVEGLAINHILTLETDLHRTVAGNAGFDLFGTDETGAPNRWIEVKAMVRSLEHHPIGMSKRQFETAQEKSTRFWLYIVENATSSAPQILKIQDPAGNARTFTFDQGWRDIATSG